MKSAQDCSRVLDFSSLLSLDASGSWKVCRTEWQVYIVFLGSRRDIFMCQMAGVVPTHRHLVCALSPNSAWLFPHTFPPPCIFRNKHMRALAPLFAVCQIWFNLAETAFCSFWCQVHTRASFTWFARTLLKICKHPRLSTKDFCLPPPSSDGS